MFLTEQLATLGSHFLFEKWFLPFDHSVSTVPHSTFELFECTIQVLDFSILLSVDTFIQATQNIICKYRSMQVETQRYQGYNEMSLRHMYLTVSTCHTSNFLCGKKEKFTPPPPLPILYLSIWCNGYIAPYVRSDAWTHAKTKILTHV